MIVCSWTLTIPDIRGKPTSFTFDLVQGESPIIIGNDVRMYCNTFNLNEQRYVCVRRPTDESDRILFTYIAMPDRRLRLDISPHPLSIKSTLLGNIHSSARRTPLTFCKRVHRYTHATPDEMRLLCSDGGLLSPELEEAIDRVHNACEVCARNGRPLPTRKVSLTHVNQGFNVEIQIDFLFPVIHGEKRTVLNITDMGTSYSELTVTEARNVQVIIHALETLWICRHGAPEAVSADDEYNRTALRGFLDSHNIKFKPRPSRRHNKTGVVERKNYTVKTIISKLNHERSQSDVSTIVTRAAFLSNLFSGSKILSSFELVRGYKPSVMGLPRTIVTEELLQAHKEQTAVRRLQKLLKSRVHDSLRAEQLNPGDPVWVFYDTSKQNEPIEWIKATVKAAHPEFVEVRRSAHGRPMRVAYEDIRIAPRGDLTAELMSCTLEEEMSRKSNEQSPAAATESCENAGESVDSYDAVPADDEAPPPGPASNAPRAQSTLLGGTIEGISHEATPACPDGGVKDVGPYATTCAQPKSPLDGRSLTRDDTKALEEIYEAVGSKQVTATHLTFAPPYILHEALQSEHEANWTDAYIEMTESDVPRQANIITSHVVYKLKTDEDGTRKMKARIVPHGNYDNEKDHVRKDSSNAPLFIVRLLLSLVTFLRFRIGTADIKGAFLQSGPIARDLYVRPPRELKAARGTLWKLLKLPYGIADAGRKWQKTVESWMLQEANLERVLGLSQLFVKRDEDGYISLLVAKVTDDFLLGGKLETMKEFTMKLQRRFVVGKVIINEAINFDGCEITQDDCGNVTMSMVRYLDRLKPIELSRSRKKERQSRATDKELTQFRSLACTLMYLGNGVLPQAAYITSILQQLIPRVIVEHLVMANDMLKELMDLEPKITFLVPPNAADIKEVFVSSFSDASFNHGTQSGYGQTGLLTGLRITRKDGVDMFHTIDWSSNKQRRVSYSPYGAEVLACADADDRGYYLKVGLKSLFPSVETRSELCTDSRCLYDTITTLHESKDYCLRPTVQRIRNSFDSHELNFMRWIPGSANPADALTKRNPNTAKLLNKLISSGVVCMPIESGFAVNSHDWQ